MKGAESWMGGRYVKGGERRGKSKVEREGGE